MSAGRERFEEMISHYIVISPLTENEYRVLQANLQKAQRLIGGEMTPEDSQVLLRQVVLAIAPLQEGTKVMEEIAWFEELNASRQMIENYGRLARLCSQIGLGLRREDFEKYGNNDALFLAVIGKGKYVRIHPSIRGDTGVGNTTDHDKWLEEEKKKDGSLMVVLAKSSPVNKHRPTESILTIVPLLQITRNRTDVLEASEFVRYTHLAHRMAIPAKKSRLPVIFLPIHKLL